MSQIEWPVRIFLDAEVKRFDSRRRRIGPVVAGYKQLRPPESRLYIVRAWRKD